VIFGEAKAMTRSDIRELVQGFVGAARFAAECGFAGIELHAGYGHLLAQFLTSQHNRRADEYGGSARNRVRIVVEIVEAVRAILPNSFCIGIKLTSSDHKAAGQLEDCVEQMKCIEKAGIDFLEISGGSFEGPKPARGTFFQKFLTAMRQGLPTIRLIVTGGSRSRRGMEAALNEGACDMLGIGRPAILDPMLPKATILNLAVPDDTAVLRTDKIKPRRFEALSGLDKVGITAENVGLLLNGLSHETDGFQQAWYTQQMHQLAGPSRTKNQTFVETGDGITVASDADDG
jgi:2,4-dienoyl-CoA reductase-like NADH-dependent reductase (Old Yellow Enzyme family)